MQKSTFYLSINHFPISLTRARVHLFRISDIIIKRIDRQWNEKQVFRFCLFFLSFFLPFFVSHSFYRRLSLKILIFFRHVPRGLREVDREGLEKRRA